MNLTKITSQFQGKRILVVGDLMLDEFLWGDVLRISPEAPVPVVSATKKTRMPGGAGNVANNLAQLGAKVSVVGVVGKDIHGRELLTLLKGRGVDTSGVVVDAGRATTLKSRIIAKSQHVVRVDTEDKEPVRVKVADEMKSHLKKLLCQVDVLTISDYCKGVVSQKLLAWLIPEAKKVGIPIVADPKIENFLNYREVTVISPNEHEAMSVSGVRQVSKESLNDMGAQLLEKLGCGAVLITRGSKGMSLFERSGAVTHIPAHAREVFDITGAGDTVTSVLSLCLACGVPMADACRIANYAASCAVGKIGTATVTVDEILKSGGE